MSILFRDRFDAGRRLFEAIKQESLSNPIVLAVPRGGIPVGAEVAKGLNAPMCAFVARKLGAPHQPEFGVGAIAEGGSHVLDQDSITALGITPDEIAKMLEREKERLARYVEYYRCGKPLPNIEGRCAVIVDDGLATGVTVQAAVLAVKRLGPARTVVATPVASEQAMAVLGECADLLVAVAVPPHFMAVGQFYRSFDQLPDERLRELALGAGRERFD